MDGVLRQVPGYSEQLPAKRDFFGDKVANDPGWTPWGVGGPVANRASPAHFSKLVDDPVKDELAKLQYGFSPVSNKYQGWDLKGWVKSDGQDAYDRLQELQGQVQMGGRTMPQALTRLITSNRYQSLPTPDGPPDVLNPSPRVKEVQRIVSDYREAAMRQLMREYPQINRDVRQHQQDLRAKNRPDYALLSRLK
jgi:hypothetical protein